MDFINPYNIIEIPLLELLRNLAIGIVFAVILSWIISKSTRLVVDTAQYLPMFLVLIPTMILIITVIKSSIALSLGLVGALSIVRFRTPIKEPEELAYIFIAIAIGLGLGANQVLATVVGFSVVVVVLLPFMFKRSAVRQGQSAYVEIILDSGEAETLNIETVSKLLDEGNIKYRIKRVTETTSHCEITLEVSRLDMAAYEKIKLELSKHYLNVEISFFDNTRVIT